MNSPPSRPGSSGALRLARRSWRLQYRDSAQSIALADQACARAVAGRDIEAESWARLTRGFHRMRYATPAEAEQELAEARRCFEATRDRAGHILASVGIARCWWLQGRHRDALELALPLRDEGLHILRDEERGMLLNTIAGCYSRAGQSAEAFAYLYQALRETSAAHNHGFDVVLYCNLAHELFELGDYYEALSYLEEGIERCRRLGNARLLATLLVNRVICLTDLGRPHDALPDVRRLLDLPPDATGRGLTNAGFESMAIAALRAGDLALGEGLIAQAEQATARESDVDEKVELVVAVAEGLRARGQVDEAAAHMERALPLPTEGLSVRVRCLFFQTLAELHEKRGDAAPALRYLRTWQTLHVERALRASQARYQAASLQTELLRLRHERDEIEARRRSTERAKAQLESINQQLSQKIGEVQALQAALREQAVRDFLTGLFNRRHLADVLPSMAALAERHREPLAVVIIDLDHFKAVNDAHGHAAGDRVLAAFGELLLKRTRKSDVALRYGGEEFLLLMPRTSSEAAASKIDVLQKLWRETALELSAGALRDNTFSAGIADSRTVRGSFDALLKAADDCVLEAKKLGRNRIVVDGGKAQVIALPQAARRARPRRRA
jgi:diguanylate cyclase (GGDEF)-like protein